MKRLISLFLIFTMAFSFNFAYAEDNKIEEPTKEILFLQSLKILDNSFKGEDKITKGEFTKITLKMLYPDMEFQNHKQVFTDVTKDNKNYSYINTAYDLKIINGSDNMFYPDSIISSTNAVVILCNALGYTVKANSQGGYPTGYLKVAKEEGLLKGLSIKNETDGFYVAKLIYNSLFAKPYTVSKIEQDGVSVVPFDKTIAEDTYNVKKYDAIVYDNGISSISGDYIYDLEKTVLYDYKNDKNISVYVNNSDIQNHLGAKVTAYVKYNEETGRNELVDYFISSNSKEYFINASDVTNIDNKGLTYEDKNENEIKINFSKDYPVVFLNGVQLSSYDFTKLIPNDGFVRIVNNDNKTECIEIISFNIYPNKVKGKARNIVVDSFSKKDKYINCRLSPGNSLKFNNDCEYKFLTEGINTISDLSKGDILSVAESYEKINGKTMYFLYVSKNVKEGKITSLSENQKEITIDDENYKVSDNLLSAKPGFFKNVKYNENAVFYIDVTGKIAYSTIATQSKNYCYIINAKVDKGGEDILKIKVLTKDGDIKVLEASGKITVDGTVYKNPTLAFNAISKRTPGSTTKTPLKRPAIIKTDKDGYITSIDTDNPNEVSSDINLYSSQQHINYSNSEAENSDCLKAGYRSPRMVPVSTGKNYTIDGRFYMNIDTVIFAVPEIDIYGLDTWPLYASNQQLTPNQDPSYAKEYELPLYDKYYRLYDLGSFDDYLSYDIQGYDIDPDTGFAGLVVLRGRNDTYWYGKAPYKSSCPIGVFLRKSEVYDEVFDRTLTKLYYTVNGFDELSVTVDLDTTFSSFKYMIEGSRKEDNAYGKDVPPLKKGDLIKVVAQDSYLTHLERVSKIDNIFTSYSSKGFPLTGPGGYSSSAYYTTIPYDERDVYFQFTANYIMALGYAKKVNADTVSLMLGKNRVSDVDFTNPQSYTDQLYYIGNASPVTITVGTDEIKVKRGEISDIITSDEAGNDINKASIVFIRQEEYNTSQMFIINKE